MKVGCDALVRVKVAKSIKSTRDLKLTACRVFLEVSEVNLIRNSTCRYHEAVSAGAVIDLLAQGREKSAKLRQALDEFDMYMKSVADLASSRTSANEGQAFAAAKTIDANPSQPEAARSKASATCT